MYLYLRTIFLEVRKGSKVYLCTIFQTLETYLVRSEQLNELYSGQPTWRPSKCSGGDGRTSRHHGDCLLLNHHSELSAK